MEYGCIRGEDHEASEEEIEEEKNGEGEELFSLLHIIITNIAIERFYGQSSLEADCSFSLRETPRKIHPTSSLVYPKRKQNNKKERRTLFFFF